MSTLICVPIMVEDAASALADAATARDLGADLVEYRIDHVFHGDGDDAGADIAAQVVDASPLPCIVTCRAASEGGAYDGDDADRISLLEKLSTLDRPPRYIDVEHATYARSANLRQKVHLAVAHEAQLREVQTSLILSAHDFDGRPLNLYKLIGQMQGQTAAAVLKLAFRARSLRDNLELFELLRERDRPTIALGMGQFGLMSRVLAPKFGGFLTFASLRDDSATAPGQPTLSDLLATYRFRSIGAQTRVYGVLGWPVEQSRSPQIHNAGFEAAQHDGVYLPLPVPPEWEHFKATFGALLDDAYLDFAGASITIPHKQHALRFALEDSTREWRLDEATRHLGAANTFARSPEGSLELTNTDAVAIEQCLVECLGDDLDGRSIAVLGAGGAARAAAYVGARLGAKVTIFNRSWKRAAALAEELSGVLGQGQAPAMIEAAALETIGASRCGCYINCTPVGMAHGPAPGASPLPRSLLEALHEDTLIFETVYRPAVTPLLATANEIGLPTIDGVSMFIAQAAGQFRAWTGLEAPRGLFERVVRESE